MIFYDRVAIVCKTKVGTNPVIETFNGTVPAIVVPMSSADVVANGGSITVTRYQLLIKPFSYLIPLNSTNSVPSTAGANQILISYGETALSLALEGKVERQLFRGRLHHYEAIVRS